MKNLNAIYKVDLLNSINEFYHTRLKPKIFILNLVYHKGTFFIEKSNYLDVLGIKELSANEVFFLKANDFDLEKIYQKMEGQNADFNEEILEFGKYMNIFEDDFEVTENLIEELKIQFTDMLDENIYSIRIANFTGKIILLIFRNNEKKFLFYDIKSFVEKIGIDLDSDSPDSHIKRPNFKNYDDVPSAKYSFIYNTNSYFLAKYLNLFEEIINKYYYDNYETYKEKAREVWEYEEGGVMIKKEVL